jgi:putative membrane protein
VSETHPQPAEGVLPPRRLDPRTVLIRALPGLPSAILAVPVVLAASRGGGLTLAIALMISALLMGVALIAGWLSWRMFTYQVLPDQLVISRGIINRSRRSIPAQRIQDVSIKQGVLARLIGLAEVRIETGGGEKDEGRLDSVSLAEAHRLRELLRGMSRAAAGSATVTPLSSDADEPILFQLGFGRLLFFGMFRF